MIGLFRNISQWNRTGQQLIKRYTTNSSVSNSEVLRDSFGRFHNYLRISLTERCNLRCQYCMPEEGVMLQAKEKIMTTDEIVRLSKLFAGVGVNKIRFTGGEPLVRPDVEELIERVGEIPGIEKIALTTNGILLPRKLARLQAAGLNQLNISLDTLDSDKFTMITRRLGWSRVMESIEMALKAGFSPVKINCVVMRGINDSEIADFVKLTQDKDIEVRFIEYMPFDGNKWSDKKFVSYKEMLGLIQERFGGVIRESERDLKENNTSKTYSIEGFKGRIGFITSMSDHFCSSCNRLRLTADGNLKVCLFGNAEVSLRDKMRSGATDQDLLPIIQSAVLNKKESHAEFLKRYIFKIVQIRNQNNTRGLKYSRCYSTDNKKITHIDEKTMMPTMVDVSDKSVSKRVAHARSIIEFPNESILSNLAKDESGSSEIQSKKGPVFATSIVAGTMAVKSTHNLIPFCHPLPIESCKIEIKILNDKKSIQVDCIVSIHHKTGVEMEALTGCSVASLTIYDMLKAITKDIIIKETKLISKSGGKSDFLSKGNITK